MPVSAAFVIKRSVQCLPFLLLGGSLIGSQASAGTPVSRGFAEKLRFGPGILNHPVNVRPTEAVSIPKDWPLGADGSIACSTCHRSVPSLEGATEFNLRGHDDTATPLGEFCTKCHNDVSVRSASAMHWMAMGVAHVKPDGGTGTGSSSSPDAESLRCLGCHDGVNASEHSNSPVQRGAGSAGGPRRAHPIGVPYNPHARAKRSAPLRHESLLPPEVRLPDGRVSCVSCHNLYAKDRYRLTVPIQGSQLCFTCHDMQ